jgi:enoyl-CoA hydratase/carnithine racemase
VVLLRAEGPSFSAGLHRALLTPRGLPDEPSLLGVGALPPDRLDDLLASYQAAFTWWSSPDVVSVAAVQGHAVGAGFQLALACDLRVVADDVRFALRETSLGLVPDLGGTKRLVELVGYSRAAAICLTGARVGAADAERMGLVNTVVPAEQLTAAGEQFVRRILGARPETITEIKALLLRAAGRSQAEQELAEREAQYRQLRLIAGLDAEDQAENPAEAQAAESA